MIVVMMLVAVLSAFACGYLVGQKEQLDALTKATMRKVSRVAKRVYLASRPDENADVEELDSALLKPAEPEPLSIFDHMVIVDTHLLRAQDYVVALGAERGDLPLGPLFTRVRESRRLLQKVVQIERQEGRAH